MVRDRIRKWYNGYNWFGEENLHNPHDILHLFSEREFRAYWFEFEEQDHLYRMLETDKVSPMQLESQEADAFFVTTFELGRVKFDALMFQSGYQTIKAKERRDTCTAYQPGYPNFAVQSSFNAGFAEYMTKCGKK